MKAFQGPGKARETQGEAILKGICLSLSVFLS